MCHQGRDWERMGQLAGGGTLLESREAQQGVSPEPTEMLSENPLQTFDQRSQSHSETGPASKSSPAPLSLPLFPGSDCKGVRIPRQQAGAEEQGTERNFTVSQAWTILDWTRVTELRLGLQTEGTLELAFLLCIARKLWDLTEFLNNGWRRTFSMKQM